MLTEVQILLDILFLLSNFSSWNNKVSAIVNTSQGPAILYLSATAPMDEKGSFNFGPTNPSRGYMEWIGNWYLTYRTAAELTELGRSADLPAESLVVSAESTGVNLYLEAYKNS